jgi:hypothetical protein
MKHGLGRQGEEYQCSYKNQYKGEAVKNQGGPLPIQLPTHPAIISGRFVRGEPLSLLSLVYDVV